VLRDRDRVHAGQGLPGEAQGAEPGGWRGRARRRARGGRRAAEGSGGTRGAGRFYGALAGQGAGRGGGETGPGRTAYGVHMMQAPMPPPLPGLDPHLVFNEVEPIIAAVVVIGVVAVALRWIFRPPVGEAIAERIRRRSQRRWGAEREAPERAAAVGGAVAPRQAR